MNKEYTRLIYELNKTYRIELAVNSLKLLNDYKKKEFDPNRIRKAINIAIQNQSYF